MGTERIRLLYIEDDDGQRRALAAALRKKGYAVTPARTGRTGLSIFRRRRFDAILCDLNIPGVGGEGVLEKARRRDAAIPFVMLTAHGEVAVAVRSIRNGADHFLLKPADPDEIDLAIRKAIERRALEAQVAEYSRNLEEKVRERTVRLGRVNRQLSALNRASARLNRINREDRLFAAAPRLLTRSLDFERAYLFVESGEGFSVAGWCPGTGAKRPVERFVSAVNKGRVQLPSHFRRSLRSKRVVFVSDTERDRWWPAENPFPSPARSVVIAPVRTDPGEAALIAGTGGDGDGPMDEREVELFETFANMTRLALENIRAYRSLEGRVRERTASLREANRELRRKAEEIDKSRIEIAKANVELFGAREELEEKNRELEARSEELARERNFVSAVLDTAGDLVCVLEPGGRIVSFNRACEETSGYAFSEVRGKPFYEVFLLPEEKRAVRERFRKLERGDFPQRGENHWVRKDGGSRLISWTNTCLLGDGGEVTHIVATGVDITALRRQEEEIATRLRYEEGLARFSRTLLAGPDPGEAFGRALVHLLDATGVERVVLFENFVDPADGLCMRLVEEATVPGVPHAIDRPEAARVPYREGFGRWMRVLGRGGAVELTAGEAPRTIERILGRRGIKSLLVLPVDLEGRWYGILGFEDLDEERRWSEEDVRALRTAAEIVGIHLERRRFEESLRVSEAKFRTLVENANDVIYSLDAEGRITYLSPKVVDVLGYTEKDLLGKPFFAVLHPDDRDKSREWFTTGWRGGHDDHPYGEYRLRTAAGDYRWFISRSSPILGEDGNLIEYIGVAHDITELKRALDELADANRHIRETQSQLVQSEKMASLGTLVAGIAHEINTPMGAVSSMHDTLFRSIDRLRGIVGEFVPADSKAAVESAKAFRAIDDARDVVASGAARVLKIVRRLRSFARLDEAELKTVDIHEGIEDTLTLIHHDLKHDITVHRRFGEVPPLACFPGQLNQVFLNLLVNARQAISGTGEISIETGVDGDRARIVISDTGHGIEPDNLSRVFDPGFTTKGVGVGTGLGLSICYQIVRNHHGEITVDSRPGEGATFTIRIPLHLEKLVEDGHAPA